MPANATTVWGVDGCPGGWLAVRLAGREVAWRLLTDLVQLLGEGDPVGIDMPMGLSGGPPRACDLAARARLGPRWMCVFHAPVRPALAAPDRATAHRITVASGGRGVSAQADGIRRRVAELDRLLTPSRQRRVIEVHPELTFAELAGRPLPPKTSFAGRRERLELLSDRLPRLAAALSGVPAALTVDALDAVAAATSTLRWVTGRAVVLPGPRPPIDSRGLAMRMVI